MIIGAGAQLHAWNFGSVLTIRLFGHPRLQSGESVSPLRAPVKAIIVLAYLATHHDAPVTRDFLASQLWPDAEPEDARANLRRHLHLLTQALAKTAPSIRYLITAMHTVRWNREAGAIVDTIAFAEASAAGQLEDATAWYTGEFLEGYDDEWILSERERFRSTQVALLLKSLRRKRSERDLSGALADVARIFRIDPWREDALRIEILLRSQLGDRSGALAAYRVFAERLRAELDVEPAAETRAVFDALARDELLEGENGELRVPKAADRAPTLPFVGRTREFDMLSSAWESAARGKGSMVLLSGEAGAGKSRLSYELGLLAESQGGGVLVGTTTPGEDQPYEAVVDALRNVLSLIVSSRTPAELGFLARVLPEIAARATIVEMPTSGPVAERTRVFEAVYACIRGLAQKRPLLVILEDLHWATASSIALVEYIARRIRSIPVLLVGTYRDEEVGRAHPLRSFRRQLETEGTLERIVLSRFDRRTVAEVVRRMFADSANPEALAAELYDYSEGVPLFLDAAVYSDRHVGPGGPLNVPERIGRLGDSARSLLEVAAVTGTGFNIDVLSELIGWNETDVLHALDELLAARFVRQGKRRRYGDYVFSHHLVHAAVYATIPQNVRRRSHALVAHALSKLYPDVPARAGEIALHYDRAGDTPRATAAYAAAAVHALQLYANDEALAYADRAFALGADIAVLVQMQIVRGWAGESLGRADIRADALQALESLEIPPQHVVEVAHLRTVHATLGGQLDVARTAGKRFLAAALASGDESSVTQAHVENAQIAINDDRYEDAEEHLALAADTLPPQDEASRLRLLRAQTFLMQRRGVHGHEVVAAAQTLLAQAVSVGDPQAEAEAHVRLAHVAMLAQRFEVARAEYDFAADAYRRFGSPRGVAGIELNAANLALWIADYDAARDLYRRCLSFAQDNAAETVTMVCAIGLTLADIYTGNTREAAATAASVEHLVRGRQILEEANWHLCRALIATESGEAAGAFPAYDAALAIHRPKQPGLLYAVTLAWAVLAALDAGDRVRSIELGSELENLPDEFLSGEEFPHLMHWAQSRVAALLGDGDRSRGLMSSASQLYDARVEAIGDRRDAYGAVPWNARFLLARAGAATGRFSDGVCLS